jgi:hypothetical protein
MKSCAPTSCAASCGRAAVIRIDQAEIPEFAALVKIRNPRRGQPQRGLRQAVERAGAGQHQHQIHQFRDKAAGAARPQDAAQEVGAQDFIILIRQGPVGLQLGLAARLYLPGRDPLDQRRNARRIVGRQIDRPRRQQSLV